VAPTGLFLSVRAEEHAQKKTSACHPGFSAAFLVFGLAVSSVSADVVGVAGEAVSVGVTITGIEGGRLLWRGRDGEAMSRSIAEVEYLQVAGWPLFNVAEKQLRERYAHQACVSYEKALEDAIAPRKEAATTADAPALDRPLLVRCRLVRAYEADRRLDRSAASYVQLLERRDGLSWQALAPRQISSPGTPGFEAAANLVSAAIARQKDPRVAVVLKEWRSTWPAASQPAREAVMRSPAPPPALPATSGAAASLAHLTAAGRYEEALAAVRRIQLNTSGHERADAYFQEAQALIARANARPDSAAVDRRRAGIALVRVVIHYPDSPRAPEALLLAGRVCRQEGNVNGAKSLWSELMARYPAELPHVAWARQDLAALGATASQPAGM
jgi:tetratricopeptide (TPR) repeat protein